MTLQNLMKALGIIREHELLYSKCKFDNALEIYSFATLCHFLTAYGRSVAKGREFLPS